MLENSKDDLCKCWKGMHNMKLQLGKIIASFQKSFYEVEHAHTSLFYEKLRGFVSRAALTCIVVEFERVRYMEIDESTCGCKLRTTYGLPCACELGRYKISGIPIPLDSIHIQWKKLSMEKSTRGRHGNWIKRLKLIKPYYMTNRIKTPPLNYKVWLEGNKYIIQYKQRVC
ncbi:hypothetical protein MTR_1g094105 [Medicago truncatula]|uniref:Protein FAR1-RELATED SEQUENCE n=1 Tax=Medicago truncatula TaxID=3880 RepID=A0A072VZI5_MEDTR|nr:hypothetical protein MTR_1g094105 [Medicago truncatula]